MKKEIWKDIPGYEGKYQVSNLGRVRNPNYRGSGLPRTLKQSIGINGYYYVGLYLTKKKRPLVHRLVAITFLENPNNLPSVNHKDENKLNNKLDNLEWCSWKYNVNYGSGIERGHSKRKIKINCYNLQGKLVKVYDSAIDAEKDGFNHSAVAAVCKGKRHTHHGHRFEYGN